jgi:hypothetical protein
MIEDILGRPLVTEQECQRRIEQARAEERERIAEYVDRVAAHYDFLADDAQGSGHYKEVGYCEAYASIVRKLAKHIREADAE